MMRREMRRQPPELLCRCSASSANGEASANVLHNDSHAHRLVHGAGRSWAGQPEVVDEGASSCLFLLNLSPTATSDGVLVTAQGFHPDDGPNVAETRECMRTENAKLLKGGRGFKLVCIQLAVLFQKST